MKKLLLLFLVLCATFVQAQVVQVQHTAYTSWFDTQKHEPIYVVWTLTPAMLEGQHLPRLSEFTADPKVANTGFNRDYDKSKWDKGHQIPAEDASGAAVSSPSETSARYADGLSSSHSRPPHR